MRFTNKGFYKVSHVIFDLDGTLLDTETLYREALQHIANIYNKECDNNVILKIAGMTQPMIAETIIEDFDLSIDVTTFLSQYNGFIHSRIGHCDLMPGAEKLINHLHSHRIPMALGTSSSAKAVEVKTKKYTSLFNLMTHSVCGESDPAVKIGKPAPDIFLEAAKRFTTKPQPHECLVFEDSINGAKAARAAGMQVVLIAEPHMPRDINHCATLRLNSMLEFEPEVFGLPSMNEKNNVYY